MHPRLALVLLPLVLLVGCGSDEQAPAGGGAPPASRPAALDQSSPEALVTGIFAAAVSGDYALLAMVADPVDADGDAKRVAGVAAASPEDQAEFQQYFAKGRIDGEIEVDGDEAVVPILFGPDGTKKETFNLVRRDGVWYLKSF